MRILLVNYEYPPVGAGAGTATEAIAKELVHEGHEVVVLTGRFNRLPNFSDVDGITIYRVPSLRTAIDRCSIAEMISFLVGALLSAPRVIRRHRIEAAIIFFSFPCGPIGLWGRWMCGVPYIVSLRGGDVPGAEPSLNYVHLFLTPARRLVLKNSIAIVANSEGLRKMAEAADPYRVCMIPNGVDTLFFQPTRFDVGAENRSGPFRILFVGRFQAQKNLSYFFKQLAGLPSGTFELHLVGDGPQKANLKTLAIENGLATAITWHGWLTRLELRDLYQSVDCLINPSLYEGMPNVVLEAMACGLPVLASNVPGNDALVVPDETGYLFDLHELDALRKAIKPLMENRSLCSRLGTNGRSRAEHDFSWRPVAQAYIELLKQRISTFRHSPDLHEP